MCHWKVNDKEINSFMLKSWSNTGNQKTIRLQLFKYLLNQFLLMLSPLPIQKVNIHTQSKIHTLSSLVQFLISTLEFSILQQNGCTYSLLSNINVFRMHAPSNIFSNFLIQANGYSTIQ